MKFRIKTGFILKNREYHRSLREKADEMILTKRRKCDMLYWNDNDEDPECGGHAESLRAVRAGGLLYSIGIPSESVRPSRGW